MTEPRAAIALGQGGAKQAERAHLAHNRAVELLLAVGREHARKQLVLGIAARGLAHLSFVFGKLAFQVERVFPGERRLGGGGVFSSLDGFRHQRAPLRLYNARCGPSDSGQAIPRRHAVAAAAAFGY